MSPLDAILAENARRRARFATPYDPLTGLGCYGERVSVRTAEDVVVHVPVAMTRDAQAGPLIERIEAAGGLHRIAGHYGIDAGAASAVARLFVELRCDHDFEFWAATSARIKTKRGGLVPFVSTPPQRKLLASLLGPFLAGEATRVVLVKARQWGGSTLTQVFIAWVQQRRRRAWNAAIVADVQAQAAHIRGMYRTLSKHYPAELGTITLAPYEGQSTVKYVPERDAIVGVASTKNPDAVRSFTYHMLHLSEVGLWGSTPQQSADDLAQSLEGGLVGGAETICVKESTAKGVGNYFHREWQAAVKGESDYQPVFVAWHEIPEYQTALTPDETARLVATLTSYERFLWGLGATLEGIAWYRAKLRSMPAGQAEWRMMAEFPSTADEAFQSTGRRVFAPEYVQAARASCRAPIGTFDVRGAATKGKAALQGVRLVENRAGGALRIWAMPSSTVPGLDLTGKRMTGRYCGFLDIGGRWHGADWHVLTIVDRAGLLVGDGPEVVAEWRCHRDQDLAAWEAAQVCTVFESALLAVEVNSLRGEDDGAGHYATILDEIGPVYRNLYARTAPPDQIGGTPVTKWGFQTNATSKVLIVDTLNALLRERGYTERAAEACDEMDYYELDERGRMNAREGQHDDRVISRAGALWLATSYMTAPRLVEIEARRTRSQVGHAALV